MSEPYSSDKTRLKISVDGFMCDFLRTVYENKNEHILMSPIGIVFLYTILLEGAQGSTADQIMEVFHLKSQFENVGEVRVELENLIKRLNQKDEDLTIRMANRAIINKDATLKQEFQEIIESNYLALLDQADFGKADALVKKLNTWVAQVTNNLITELLEKLNQNDILVVINVLYFKGSWLEFFLPCTEKQCFYNYDGTESDIEMMFLKGIFEFSNLEEEKLKIIRLPYKKGVDMYVFRPSERSGIQTLISNLEADKIEGYIQSLKPTELSTVMIPKFQFEDSHDLLGILNGMGLHLPFSPTADFSGISDAPIHVSKSIQKTVIKVDEKGTEAAAASLVICSTSARSSEMNFIADRPFIFFIRDEETCVNLFVGVVKKFPNARPSDNTSSAGPLPDDDSYGFKSSDFETVTSKESDDLDEALL